MSNEINGILYKSEIYTQIYIYFHSNTYLYVNKLLEEQINNITLIFYNIIVGHLLLMSYIRSVPRSRVMYNNWDLADNLSHCTLSILCELFLKLRYFEYVCGIPESFIVMQWNYDVYWCWILYLLFRSLTNSKGLLTSSKSLKILLTF